MTYTSILVNLNLGQPNGRTLAVAQQLVQRFGTEVMGVALPLLARARHVQLLEIADEGDHKAAQLRLDDLVTWLARHQVVAQTSVVLGNPDNSDQLGSIANELGADLVVAGAYGHSRLREWVLGGVTRNLLQGEQRCSLLSH